MLGSAHLTVSCFTALLFYFVSYLFFFVVEVEVTRERYATVSTCSVKLVIKSFDRACQQLLSCFKFVYVD